jgi:hypothetical protein
MKGLVAAIVVAFATALFQVVRSLAMPGFAARTEPASP